MVLRGRARTRAPVDAAIACHAAAVSKVYGTRETAVHALRDVTLDIPRGRFTAIMGPSGSGKSTLLHCLAALDTPTTGRVFLGGTELTALSRRQQAQVRRDRIGFVFQSFNLVPTLDALENITLPQLLAGRRPDRAWLHHVIARVGLGDRLHHRPSELSGGQQQRIALARALAGRPEVIFADEPTGNLDTTASREMLTLLRDAVDQFEQTVVTVTHDPSIASYADQILYFSDGRVVDRTGGADASHEFDRPRHGQGADSGSGPHDRGLPARRRADGQQTMRSRRRRQPEEPAPGRPMVGSDDEVEVARQERWLQRIREQFEAEYAAPDETAADPAAADPGWARDGIVQQPVHLTDGEAHLTDGEAHLTDDQSRRTDEHIHWTDQYTHDTDERVPVDGTYHTTSDVHQGGVEGWQDRDVVEPHAHRFNDPDHSPAPFHHDAADANGWLPPERARLHEVSDTTAPEAQTVGPGGDRWREDTVSRSEIAPWSRPSSEVEAFDAPGPTQPTETSGWRLTGDPWAPADEHRAEEYHIEQSPGRRGRGRQHDSGDVWSTGRWEAQAHHTHGEDRADAEPVDADRGDRPIGDDTDDDLPDPSPASDESVGQTDADRDTRYAHWRHDDDPDGGHHPATNGRHADEAPPSVNGQERDPWTNVWDAAAGPDIGEIWTPTFDHTWHANGNGQVQHDRDAWDDARDPTEAGDHRGDAAVDGHGPVDASDPQHEADDVRDADDPLEADAPVDRSDDDVSRDHVDDAVPGWQQAPFRGADPVQPSAAEEAAGSSVTPAAVTDIPASPATPTEVTDTPPSPATPTEVTDTPASPAPPPVTTAARRSDAPVPPPLASLRNTRRPDEPRDPMEALQSLQEQLDRLGTSGRRGGRRPRRTGSSDTNRSEH